MIGRIGVVAACALGAGPVALAAVAAAAAAAPAPAAPAPQAALAAAGQGAGGSTGSQSLVSATLEQCISAVDQATRTATFNGQMSSVAGAHRMAMEILVQEQAPGEAAFHTLPGAPGGWRRSEGGVKIYKYVRQVTDLPAPGAYRALVLYRWLNEKGHVIKRVTRHTPVCVQLDERPKLVVAQVQVSPAPGAQLAHYQVVVRNDGRSAAGPFAVALSVGGVAQPPLKVPALDAGARTVLDAQAPACTAGSAVEVLLDPQHQIAEAAGGGQSDTVPCPLTAARAARR